jgi:NAD(P)-dependent dehydrogenase (short-subunit alcohol dehydrogenase family)
MIRNGGNMKDTDTVCHCLAGKKIIVIGGAGLLGSRLCERIVRAGASCIIADASMSGAEKTATDIAAATGIRPMPVDASITDKGSIDRLLGICNKEFGAVDGVVNCAYPRNVNYGRKFEDVTFEDFCENVNLHLGGYFLLAQRVLEHMKRAGGGTLISISSIYGVIAPRFEIYDGTLMTMPVEYAAIKSAIIHLAKYMAKYYRGSNIRVNTVSPGGLFSSQPEPFLRSYRKHSLDKGMLSPDDVAGTVVFLLSDDARYVNGQNIIVDDGWTL